MKDKLIKIGKDAVKLVAWGFCIGSGCMLATGLFSYIFTTFLY
jgi:hypothetical protein